MAKHYKYTKNVTQSFSAFGVFVCPHHGTVETTWVVPTKYHDLVVDFIEVRFNSSVRANIQYRFEGGKLLVKFIRNLNYEDMFSNLFGSSLDQYNQIMSVRNCAINEAAFQVTLLKENFQDMVRGRFYTERMIKNPSNAE